MNKTWQVMYGGGILVAQFDHEKDAEQLVRYDSNNLLGLRVVEYWEDFNRTVFTGPLNNIEAYWIIKMKCGKEI